MPFDKNAKNQGACSINFIKYVLFIFNFVFLLAGCVVLGVGIWTIVEKHQFVSLLSSGTYASVAYLLIVSGVMVLIVTVIGCVGVWKEDRCALLIYTFMLLLIFLMEAVSGILAYVYADKLRTELEANLNSTFLSSYMLDDARTRDIDALQREYKCCGASDPDDWQYSAWLKHNPQVKNAVPDSCCRTESPGCGVSKHPSNINAKGCVRKLEVQLKEHLIILGAVGLGICVVQLFGLILSCCLYVKLKDYQDRYNY